MNNVHRWITISLASVSLCGASWAATVVKRDIQGKTQDIVMEGQQIRIQTQAPNYYTLMALDKGKVYMVDNKKKRIVEMDIVGNHLNHQGVCHNISLSHLGGIQSRLS